MQAYEDDAPFVLLAVVLINGWLLVAPPVQGAQREVHLSVGEYVPYSSPDMQGEGLTLHIIRESFRLEGYEVRYRFLPWRRAWSEALRDDGLDGSAYWFPSPERASHFLYSDPLVSEEYVFFHLATLPFGEWSQLGDLAPYRIGATRAYTYTPEFHRLARSGALQVDFVNRDLQNFRKLLLGRVDVVPGDMLGGYYLMRLEMSEAEIARVTFNPRPMMTTTQHLLLHRERPRATQLLQAFNRGLQRLKQSGKVDAWLQQLLRGRFDPWEEPAGEN